MGNLRGIPCSFSMMRRVSSDMLCLNLYRGNGDHAPNEVEWLSCFSYIHFEVSEIDVVITLRAHEKKFPCLPRLKCIPQLTRKVCDQEDKSPGNYLELEHSRAVRDAAISGTDLVSALRPLSSLAVTYRENEGMIFIIACH